MDNNTLVSGFDDTKIDYLQVRLQEIPQISKGLLIFLSGELNTQNSPQFQRKIDLCISAGYHKLLFSCGSLSYMSSNGVGSFAYILKALKVYEGRLCLFAVPPRVYEVLSLLGFSTFLHCETEMDDAEKYLLGNDMRPTKPAAPLFAALPLPPVASPVFPKVFKCPRCGISLRTSKAGKFRCSKCKGVIQVHATGKVAAIV